MGNEEPHAGVIPAKLMDQRVGVSTRGATDLQMAIGLQRREQCAAAEGNAVACRIQHSATVGGHGVFIFRCLAHKDQLAARLPEGLQSLQRGGAQRLAFGHDDHVVGHFAHLERSACLGALLRQQGLRNKVEVNAAAQQPAAHVGEALVHSGAHKLGLLRRAPMEPIALHRMDHAHTHHGHATGHGRSNAGKMILNGAVFLIPGGLVGDGGGIVTLGVALHGHPGEVRHAHRNTKGGLPVTMELVTTEIEIPTRHAVKLAHHTRPTVLVHRRLRLLCGGVFQTTAEHINAGNMESPIGAHSLAQRRRLRLQGGLLHHVTGQRHAVFFAPIAALICKGGGKQLCHQVVVVVTGEGNLPLRQIPQQLRQLIEEIVAVFGNKRLRNAVCPGQLHPLTAVGKGQRLLATELGLVGKDGGHGFAELVTHLTEIRLVGHLNEFFHCIGVQGIEIRLPVVPGVVSGDLPPNVPAPAHGLLTIRQASIGGQRAVFIQLHVKARHQKFVRLSGGIPLVAGKKQIALTVAAILGDDATRSTGGPSVLVVEPRQHILFLGVIHAGTDQPHIFLAQVLGLHARAHVHMEAAKTHFLKNIDLPQQLVLIKLAVPGPEGRAAILTARCLEKCVGKLFRCLVAIVNHILPPLCH